MPLLIDDQLPARQRLMDEGIVCLSPGSARPDLRVAVLNLMPEKEMTEYHLLSRLGRSDRRVQPIWLLTESHSPKNADKKHLEHFYTTWSKIKDESIEGLIVTGAPVEMLPFEAVNYWPELQRVFDWGADRCRALYAICWAAQAALYHFWDIDKTPLPHKLSGVYPHEEVMPKHPLTLGIQSGFEFPYSRYTGNPDKPIRFRKDLEMVAHSKKPGPAIVTDRSRRLAMVTGHPEYDCKRLRHEYLRDLDKGLKPQVPENAFPGNDPSQEPLCPWESPGTRLYQNWLQCLE